MMKLRVVLFVVFVASVCAIDAENAAEKEWKRIYKTCLDKMNMTMEEADNFLKEDKINPKLYCLNGCILVEEHTLKKNGSVNKRVVAQIAKEKERRRGKAVAEAYKKCFHFKKELSLCEKGRVVGECIGKIPE